jgi:hypothetical protein
MKYLLIGCIFLIGCVDQKAAEEAAYKRLMQDKDCVAFGEFLKLKAHTINDQGNRYCFIEVPTKMGVPGYALSFEELDAIYRYNLILQEIK